MGGLARPYPSWMGADHADDLQYMFGKPFSTPLGYWPRHRDVSGYMIAYWTNFAKTGYNSADTRHMSITEVKLTAASIQPLHSLFTSTETPTKGWVCPLPGPNSPAVDTSSWRSILTWIRTMCNRTWGCVTCISGPASCPAFLQSSLNKELVQSPVLLQCGMINSQYIFSTGSSKNILMRDTN